MDESFDIQLLELHFIKFALILGVYNLQDYKRTQEKLS